MRNLPESRHAPVNSVISQWTASMRSATARESTRHAALFCVGAGQMGSNDLPPYAPPTPYGKRPLSNSLPPAHTRLPAPPTSSPRQLPRPRLGRRLALLGVRVPALELRALPRPVVLRGGGLRGGRDGRRGRRGLRRASSSASGWPRAAPPRRTPTPPHPRGPSRRPRRRRRPCPCLCPCAWPCPSRGPARAHRRTRCRRSGPPACRRTRRTRRRPSRSARAAARPRRHRCSCSPRSPRRPPRPRPNGRERTTGARPSTS